MKKGFYYFKLLDQYTITYIKDENETQYFTNGVLTISPQKIKLENEEKNYILKDSHTLQNYILFSTESFDKYRNIIIRFIFEVMK
ncbi:MAG: hypothetical protein ACOC3V_02955 [bacterium]